MLIGYILFETDLHFNSRDMKCLSEDWRSQRTPRWQMSHRDAPQKPAGKRSRCFGVHSWYCIRVS